MIKKVFTIMFASILISVPVIAHAQTSSVDDSKIEESLRANGVDKAPDVVDVPKSEMRGLEPSSGFVDKNGKPLSDAEYAQYLKDNEGIFKKYPWILPIVVLVIGGGIVFVVQHKKKNSK
jgi:hypothetical protein